MPEQPLESSAQPDLALLQKALQIIAGKWRLAIVLVLAEQTWRYSEIRERLPSVSEKVLADELKALVALGVLHRNVYAQVPPRVEYSLTQKGRLALPIFQQLPTIGRIFT